MEQIPKKKGKQTKNKNQSELPSKYRINYLSTNHIEHIAWWTIPVMNMMSVEATFLHYKSPKASCLRQMERKHCCKRSPGKWLVQSCSPYTVPDFAAWTAPAGVCALCPAPWHFILRSLCWGHLGFLLPLMGWNLGSKASTGAPSSAASTLIKPFLCTCT